MGADYDMAATPGLQEGGYEYYTLAGAERLRDALQDFDGGRVLVSVLGQPFKCPPAPFEGAFMLHEHFKQRGMADAVEISSAFPVQRPVPVTGEVAQMFRDGLAARGIAEIPEHLVTGIDPSTRTAQIANRETLSYDLFVGIPKHRAPDPCRSRRPCSSQTRRADRLAGGCCFRLLLTLWRGISSHVCRRASAPRATGPA
jgi:sulfide:quinone oxidoreductase